MTRIREGVEHLKIETSIVEPVVSHPLDCESDTGPDSPSSTMSNEDDYKEQFAVVLRTMKLEALPTLAIRLRQDRIAQSSTTASPVVNDVKVESIPLTGAFHILYPITFSDGVKWIIKIPETGSSERFSDRHANRLRSEALTMRMIRKETTLPLPEVIAFDSTGNNEIGVPYIMLEFIDGVGLYKVWFGPQVSAEVRHQRRSRALEGVADAIVQLARFSSDESGAPLFDDGHEFTGTGPEFRLDLQLMTALAFVDSSEDDEADVGSEAKDQLDSYYQAGPYKDCRSWFSSWTSRMPQGESAWIEGMQKLLTCFISKIPEPDDDGRPFVLAHPDFDIQNFLVSEDGELRSIIDWDGVSMVPRSVGHLGYPKFLTRDMADLSYQYDQSRDKPLDDGEKSYSTMPQEDSPEALARYRTLYSELISQRLEQTPTEKSTIDLTKNSRITDNLLIAAENPTSMQSVVQKVFEEVRRAVGQAPDEEDPDEDEQDEQDVSSDDIGSESENKQTGSQDDDDQEREPDPDSFLLWDTVHAMATDTLGEKQIALLEQGFDILMGVIEKQ